jgi:hypothetical protein
MKREFGDIYIADNSGLFQYRIAHKSPSWRKENRELMFDVAIILQAFDLL